MARLPVSTLCWGRFPRESTLSPDKSTRRAGAGVPERERHGARSGESERGLGSSDPLGAHRVDGGTNFSVWSRTAVQVSNCCSSTISMTRGRPRTIPLDPHPEPDVVLLARAGARRGAGTGLRVARHTATSTRLPGCGTTRRRCCSIPYGVAVAVPTGYDRMAGTRPGRDPRTAMKSVVVDLSAYDWEGDVPLGGPSRALSSTSFTSGASPPTPTAGWIAQLAGTYAGLVAKIPYLRSLGVTAVELMPVQAFDPQDAPPGLVNYWGYSPVSFFAPHPAYASTGDPLGVLDEFRTMVKELHRAGIEVILDVVFNHTAEGDADGTHVLLARAGQPGLLPARPGEPGELPGLHRVREHPERQPFRGPPDDRRRAAPLGGPDARGRLPLRPRLDHVAGHRRALRWPTRRSSGRSRATPCWPAPS